MRPLTSSCEVDVSLTQRDALLIKSLIHPGSVSSSTVPSLIVIAVEEFWVCPLLNRCELPTEVVRVLDSSAHPLTASVPITVLSRTPHQIF